MGVAVGKPYSLWGSRGTWANYEVVGEFYHQDEARAILSRPLAKDGRDSVADTHVASLIPEPDNPKDRNAISVRIAGRLVGYLTREDAPRYKPAIDRVVASGYEPTVLAKVWASNEIEYDWNTEDDEPVERVTGLDVRISLALADPHLLLPLNDPPTAPHSILPANGSVQVTGEEHHFDVLREHVLPEGESLLIATLHEVNTASARTMQTLVEVRVDGRRIGQLTPKMSTQFLPAIRHMQDRGLAVAARAHLKGSDVAAQVTLLAERSHGLPADWLNGEPEDVPSLVPVSGRYAVPKAYNARSSSPRRRRATSSTKRSDPSTATVSLANAAPTSKEQATEPASRREMTRTSVILVVIGLLLAAIPTVGPYLTAVVWVLAGLVLIARPKP